MAENSSNLEMTEQLLKVQGALNKLVEEFKKTLSSTIDVTKSMVDNMQKVSSGFSNSTKQAEDFKKVQEEVAEDTEKLGTNGENLEKSVVENLKKAAAQAELLGKSVTGASKNTKGFGLAAANAMDGFLSGINLSINALSSMASITQGVIGFVFNLGKAIISAPFRMLNSLISDMGSGSNELQQAIENVRKEFGNLREATGKATMDMARHLKGELANTGLSVYRVFGSLAQRLEAMLEYAKNLGPLFGVMAGQMARSAEAVGAFYKGLGLTAEGQKAVAARAYASGQQMTEVLRQVANYSIQLGHAFGLSAKEISRDMGTMMADFSHFGHLAPRALAEVSVYARRLGIDIKAMGEIMDRWNNFEDAATGAAQLSQAFGLNINALDIMKAQNPAQRVEILRKAFFAAGRSVENMSIQERHLLSAQSGVNEESLGLVFSLKNQSLSYDQVQKKAQGAQKHQLSQAEAMQKLAGAIERLVQSGNMGHGGFFDRFFQGFERGIRWTRDFQMLMRNLRLDLNSTFRAGIQVGQAFEHAFPGVHQFIAGLADLFNTHRFRGMLNGVVSSFRRFFVDLDFHQLLQNLRTGFLNWLQADSPAGRNMLNGLQRFFSTLSTIVGSALKEAISGLSKGIIFISDIIAGRKSLAGVAAGAKGVGGFLWNLLQPVFDAIKERGPELFRALKALFIAVKNRVVSFLEDHWKEIFLTVFGPAILSAALRAVISGLASSMGSLLLNGLKSAIIAGAEGTLAEGLTAALGSLGAVFSEVLAPLLAAALVLGLAFWPNETDSILKNIGSKIWNFAKNAGDWIKTKLIDLFPNSRETIEGVFASISAAADIAKGIIVRVYEALKTQISFIVAIARVGIRIIEFIANVVWHQIQPIINSYIEGAHTVIKAWDSLKTTFTNIFDHIKSAVGTAMDWINTKLGLGPNGTVSRIQSLFHGAGRILGAIEHPETQKSSVADNGDAGAFAQRQREMAEARERQAATMPEIPDPNQAESHFQNIDRRIAALHTHASAAVPVIAGIVAQTNQINDSLATIEPANLNVGLRRVADAAGIGANETFTIRNRNFEITNHVNVTLSVEDIERALITRPGTRIVHQT